MTCRQKATKCSCSSKWKNNNRKGKNYMVKYGFVIILIKIAGHNDPGALGMLKRLRKQTCFWQTARSASGCGNILDRLAATLTAVSATIWSCSSKMCMKFTGSFHLVTKKPPALGLIPVLLWEILKPTSYGRSDRGFKQACHLLMGLYLEG